MWGSSERPSRWQQQWFFFVDLSHALASDLNSRLPYKMTLCLFDDTSCLKWFTFWCFFHSSLIELLCIPVFWYQYQVSGLIWLWGQPGTLKQVLLVHQNWAPIKRAIRTVPGPEKMMQYSNLRCYHISINDEMSTVKKKKSETNVSNEVALESSQTFAI